MPLRWPGLPAAAPARGGWPPAAWPCVLLAWLLLLAWPIGSKAQELLPVPTLDARVIDQTGTLDASQKASLESQLAAIEQQAGSQVVVVLVRSTKPEDIADFTQRLGDAWKIGRREFGDGVLLVVATEDRRVRIAPAKALEGAIPDLAARQIIDRTITPAFRAGDYAGGLSRAVTQLGGLIRGEGLPAPSPADRAPAGLQIEELAIFFFAAVPIMAAVLTGILGRKLGALATSGAAGGIAWWISASVLLGVAAGVAALVLVGVFGIGAAARGSRGGVTTRGPVIWGGGGGGWGGGRGGGGGGGFRSGGGGNFGGGGASGGW